MFSQGSSNISVIFPFPALLSPSFIYSGLGKVVFDKYSPRPFLISESSLLKVKVQEIGSFVVYTLYFPFLMSEP